MQGHLAMQDLTLTSVLTASKPSFIPSLTKVIGTLGPNSRSVEVIESCLKAGMSVARFDFTWSNGDYHQETLENLTKAVKKCTKTCAVMVDTIGPELQVCNKSGNPVELKSDSYVTITSDLSKGLSADILPINYAGLAKAVKKGDTIFLGQYLFSGHETTSAWLEVHEIKGEDVVCLVKNSATLDGSLFTLHVSQVHIDMPTLTETDKQIISTWATKNKADFISLSYTRHADDIRELRDLLKKNNLQETKILAKIETVEGLNHFNEILNESDGIILCRGKLGIDLPPEKVFVFQKAALNKCNLAGKPAIVTRVLDSLTGNLRPTRAEATDVANAVLDGADSIMLGAETLRGLYPVEAIKTVGNICAEAEKVYNQAFHFKKIIRHVGEPMSYAEAVASSAVRVAAKVKAAIIVVFTSSGGTARLIAKYRPATPVVAVVIPRLRTEVKNWTFVGSVQVRQLLGVRGVYPILGSPEGSSKGKPEEYALKLALDHGKSVGLVKAGDQIVIFQKIEDSSVVKIIDYNE